MTGTVVGVLRGGPSYTHDLSLKTGHAVLTTLPKEKYTTRDIFIDRAGVWHVAGRPVLPAEALRSVDVVFNGLHGEYGEDGEVQKILQAFGVPYTGSDPFSSYLAMHKVLAKEKAAELGILTPRYVYIEPESDISSLVREVTQTFLQPVVVKPPKWGSSLGVSLAHGGHEIMERVKELIAAAGGVIIEERIRGREASAGVVEGLRGESLYALPAVEIVPHGNEFFSYDAKYGGQTEETCPGRFSKKEKKELERIAKVMHQGLGLRHYSRSDFIVSPRGIYYLETNTLPGLTQESLLPKSLSAVGVSFPEFLEHLISLAAHG